MDFPGTRVLIVVISFVALTTALTEITQESTPSGADTSLPHLCTFYLVGPFDADDTYVVPGDKDFMDKHISVSLETTTGSGVEQKTQSSEWIVCEKAKDYARLI